MAEIEFFVEDVHVQSRFGFIVDGAFALGDNEDLAVIRVTERGHHVVNLFCLFAVRAEVNIGVGASHGGLQVTELRTVYLKSQRPDHAQENPFFLTGFEDAFEFVLEFFAFGLVLLTHPNGTVCHGALPRKVALPDLTCLIRAVPHQNPCADENLNRRASVETCQVSVSLL